MARSTSPTRRKPRFRERHAGTLPVPAPVPAATPPPPPPQQPAPHARAAARPRHIPQLRAETALYGTIVAIAFTLRIWDVGSRAMHGDEAVHAWLAWNLFTGAGYQYDPVYHGPFQFPLTAVMFFLFGVSNVSGRLLAVLFGTGLVALPYFFRREMGRVAALLAALFIAVSPAFVYDSRLERDDIFTSFFAVTLAIAIWGYVRTRQSRYVYLGAASIALSLAAMENTYITLFVFGSFVLLVLVTEGMARRRAGRRIRQLAPRFTDARVLVGAGIFLLAALLLTIFTGLYVPVPVVIVLLLIGMAVATAAQLPDTPEQSLLSAARGIRRATWINAVTILVSILVLFYSTFGSNLHGIWDAGKPLLNSGTACPGNSFPLNPCRKDIIGGLFYWLSQHKVARGGQPWFYYTFLDGLYEQIAVVFGIAGIIWTLRRPTMFTMFLTWWALVMFGVYSWAGEKFPWLMIHALLPFLLLGAMFVAQVAQVPGIRRVVVLTALGLLGLLQLHNMFEVNFVNGADPVEMMVYVQSAPDTPQIASDILAISNKVTNGNDLHVTIDAFDTWPFAWYLRSMPNVAYPGPTQILQKPYSTNPVILVDAQHRAALAPQLKGYTGKPYILRWWFPEDYKTLSWSTFLHRAANPQYWSLIGQWWLERRPFGPKGSVDFYYYVKRGLASPF